MILNQAQAEAVYSAMCSLNNVGGRASIKFAGDKGMYEEADGGIVVFSTAEPRDHTATESYTNQSVFAAAYSLQ